MAFVTDIILGEIHTVLVTAEDFILLLVQRDQTAYTVIEIVRPLILS